MSALPRGWIESTIGEVCNYVQRGKSPKYAETSRLPIINQKCVRWTGVDERFLKFVDPQQWSSWTEERFLVREDVLWNSTGTGTIGRAALFEGLASSDRAVVDSHITILRPGGAVSGKFLHRFIQSPAVQNAIADMQSGTTNQVELNRAQIVETVLPLPPLAEQMRIVAKLDALNAKSARARTELARVETLVSRYKQAVLSQAFNGELTNEWRELAGAFRRVIPRSDRQIRPAYRPARLQSFEPPYDLPEAWDWHTLPSLGDLDRGRSRHRPRNDPSLFGGPYPFIQTGDVRAADQYVRRHTQTYNEAGLSQSRLWPRDTLCITIAANIAETAILSYPACFPDSVVGFTADLDKILPKYAEFFLRTVRERIAQFAPATAQKNINLEILAAVRIPIAPLEEQLEIVRRIESAFNRIDRLAAEAKRALHLLGKLDDVILSRAVRGKLVPQNSSDEPASVLLERIRAERETAPKVRTKRTRRVTTMQTAADFLNTKLESWPNKGTTTFDELRRDFNGSYEDLKSAVFASLSGAEPRLEQVFDEKADAMMIRKR